MSDTYSSENLKKLAKMGELAPQSMQAFQQFDRQAFAEGALSVKSKDGAQVLKSLLELIAAGSGD